MKLGPTLLLVYKCTCFSISLASKIVVTMKQDPIYRNSVLTRYGSAPESFLSSIVEDIAYEGGEFIIGSGSNPTNNDIHKNGFFGGGDNNSSSSQTISESNCHRKSNLDGAGGGGLLRHSSMPAGFLSHAICDEDFAVDDVQRLSNKQFNSQPSFSKQNALPQYSNMRDSSEEAAGYFDRSFISSNYIVGSYDHANSIDFASIKRSKYNNEYLNNYQCQRNSTICKVRAKRGCATNPRSLAERERRKIISNRISKLDGFIPNIDKQTSQSEKLDFAVLHIKALQKQIEDLKQERANCTCACKQEALER